MKKHFVHFHSFFNTLINLCLRISAIERSHIFDLKTEGKQRVHTAYLNSVKERCPDAIFGFFLAMEKASEGIEFLLDDNFGVIVNFSFRDQIIKELRFSSIEEATNNIPVYINFLTRKWDPLQTK